MNTLSDIEWEIEQIEIALEYYTKAISKADSYESHKRYASVIAKLNSQLVDLKSLAKGNEDEPC